jgi:NO-binding membrane sensor protein with MHYT domain
MGATGLLTDSYNPAFVGLSVAMYILVSAASPDVADRFGGSVGWLRLVWILAARIAMGGGIWAMHFIAMLAFNLPVPMTYEVPPTLGSLLLAIAVTSVAFVIVCGGKFSIPRLILGGLIMGLGVAGMHYTGMTALRAPAEITFLPLLVVASIAIAIAASIAALWIALRVTGFAWRLAAAVVMGLAVSSTHYTGMAATCFTAEPSFGSGEA